MGNLKLTKAKISELGSEFAAFLNNHYLDKEDFADWDSNDYLNFVDEHYDEFVQYVSGEELIDEIEKEYLQSYDDDIDAFIKEVTIEELKDIL